MISVEEALIDEITAAFHYLRNGRVPPPIDIPDDLPDNEIRQLAPYLQLSWEQCVSIAVQQQLSALGLRDLLLSYLNNAGQAVGAQPSAPTQPTQPTPMPTATMQPPSAPTAPPMPQPIPDAAGPTQPSLPGMTPEIENELRAIAEQLGVDWTEGVAMARQHGLDAPTAIALARQQLAERGESSSSEGGGPNIH